MSDRIHALAQHFTGKKTIDELSTDELRHMAQRHPYFAPAQFLLLQKLRQSGSTEEAEAQYRKAVLFYHDPLLFENFIAANKFYVEEVGATESPEINPEVYQQEEEKAEPVTEFKEELIQEENEPVLDVMPGEVTDRTQAEQVEIEQPDNTASIEDFHPEEQNVQTEEPVNEIKDEAIAPEIINEAFVSETSFEAPTDSVATEQEPAVEKEEIPLPALKINEPEQKTTELTFEPFHTVDYFASQGIKISQEEAPKDKLGKQLKSFTEWIRTMKRLPASQITDAADSSAEKRVETLASHSVSESNVVTEAMAEVWLKQGNREKALDIYNKLSLLNPSKNAYFATKIQNLKQS